MFCHPSSAGEMAVMDAVRSHWLGRSIDAENEGNRLAPVGTIGRRVEHAHIELHMLTVIIGQFRAFGRMVEEIWWRHIRAPEGQLISAASDFVNHLGAFRRASCPSQRRGEPFWLSPAPIYTL